MPEPKLKGTVVGCRGMGTWHARSVARSREFELVGVCDLDESLVKAVVTELPGARAYTSLDTMLEAERPDLLVIATPNTSHASLTIHGAKSGVRAICCEKPMAVEPFDARAMVAACRGAGVPLIINHQRRTLPSMVRMRELIMEGAIGEVQVIRGTCQGDLLTDGTHVIDSLLHLTGDPEVDWVFGSVYRDPPPEGETPSGGFTAAGGSRYGHVVESGSMSVCQFAGGPRAEIFTGGLHLSGRQYNDYEAIGTRGRLWRTGDRDQPGVLFQAAGSGEWQPIEGEFGKPETVISDNLDRLAAIIRGGGGDHPLSADRALRGFEILTAIFESARLRRKLVPPVEQQRFPLKLMIEAAEI